MSQSYAWQICVKDDGSSSIYLWGNQESGKGLIERQNELFENYRLSVIANEIWLIDGNRILGLWFPFVHEKQRMAKKVVFKKHCNYSVNKIGQNEYLAFFQDKEILGLYEIEELISSKKSDPIIKLRPIVSFCWIPLMVDQKGRLPDWIVKLERQPNLPCHIDEFGIWGTEPEWQLEK